MAVKNLPLSPADRKKQIAEAVAKLATKKLMDDIIRADVAQAAKVSPSLITKYFPKRSDWMRAGRTAAKRLGLTLKDTRAKPATKPERSKPAPAPERTAVDRPAYAPLPRPIAPSL